MNWTMIYRQMRQDSWRVIGGCQRRFRSQGTKSHGHNEIGCRLRGMSDVSRTRCNVFPFGPGPKPKEGLKLRPEAINNEVGLLVTRYPDMVRWVSSVFHHMKNFELEAFFPSHSTTLHPQRPQHHCLAQLQCHSSPHQW